MTTGQRLPTPVGAGLAIEQMAIDELRPDPAGSDAPIACQATMSRRRSRG